METRDSLKEKAELIIWECRERYKFETKEECLLIAAKCMAFAKVILGYV